MPGTYRDFFSEDTTKIILAEMGGRGLGREDSDQNNKICFSGPFCCRTSKSLL